MGNIVIVGALGTAFLCVLLAVMYPNVNPRMRKKDALQHFRKLNEVTDNYRFRNVFLPGILKVRVPGTNGNTEVREFIESQLRVLNDWTVEIDDFNDSTPIGTRRFVNIVATLNPLARKRLVLAAHYDSKLIRADSTSGEFVGATDSAVPCAMLLDVAFSLQTLLRQRKTNLNLTLQLIFFDGEEAFVRWTDQDSLYGSRHLAASWETMEHPAVANFTLLEAIDVFILLDLIGAPKPTFYNQFANTSNVFERFEKLEKRLAKLQLLRSYRKADMYFKHGLVHLGISDDHLPFIQRGVPIVHLISYPFPSVWHKPSDNFDALDFDVIHNLNLILRSFVAEYLDVFSTKL